MTANPTPLPPEGVMLEPCPLCGGAPKLNGNLARGAFGVVCGNKHHVQTYGATSAEAITAWNHRIAATSAAQGEATVLGEELRGDADKLVGQYDYSPKSRIVTLMREAADALDKSQTRATMAEAANARLREALEPLARLEIPKKPQGNAGAYSIRHSDILRAREALDQGAEG